MKTTIKINGLDVEFSDQKPTRPGAYWWVFDAKQEPAVFEIRLGAILYVTGGNVVSECNGLWSATLVPVAEVEKAYLEGFINAHHKANDSVKSAALECFEESNARKVVEGRQP